MLMTLLTGCASDTLTREVWTATDFKHHCMPAPEPKLRLFESGEDILVTYDELDEKRDVITRRAYLLNRNQSLIARNRKPSFEKSAKVSKFAEIPCVTLESEARSSATRICYMAFKQGRSFSIFQDGNLKGTYELPFYLSTSGTMTRALLTPFSAVGDLLFGTAEDDQPWDNNFPELKRSKQQ